MTKFKIIAATFALSLPAAALAADAACCPDMACCQEGAECCDDAAKDEDATHAGHDKADVTQR